MNVICLFFKSRVFFRILLEKAGTGFSVKLSNENINEQIPEFKKQFKSQKGRPSLVPAEEVLIFLCQRGEGYCQVPDIQNLHKLFRHVQRHPVLELLVPYYPCTISQEENTSTRRSTHVLVSGGRLGCQGMLPTWPSSSSPVIYLSASSTNFNILVLICLVFV